MPRVADRLPFWSLQSSASGRVAVGSVSTYSFIQNTGRFTVISFANFNRQTGSDQGIFGTTVSSPNKGFWFSLTAAGQAQVYAGNGTTTAFLATTSSNIFPRIKNKWAGLVWRGSGTLGSSMIRFSTFVDSALTHETPTATTTSLSTGDSAAVAALGAFTTAGLIPMGEGNYLGKTLVYNRELSNDELENLFYNHVVPTNGLVSHWSLDNLPTNPNTVTDDTGLANGAITSMTWSSNNPYGIKMNTVSQPVRSLEHTGASGVIVSGTQSTYSYVQNTGVFTILSRIYLTPSLAEQGVFSTGGADVITQKCAYIGFNTSSYLYYAAGDGTGTYLVRIFPTIKKAQLHNRHATVVIRGNGSYAIAAVYVDGQVLMEYATTAFTVYSTGDSATSGSVGALTTSGSYSLGLGSKHSEFATWNRYLSDSEMFGAISGTMPSSGLVTHIPFTDAFGSPTVATSAGTALTYAQMKWSDLSPYSIPTPATETINSLQAEASNSCVSTSAPLSTYSFIQNTGLFTIATLVNINVLGGAGNGLLGNSNSGSIKGFYLFLNSDGSLRFAGGSDAGLDSFVANSYKCGFTALRNGWAWVFVRGNGSLGGSMLQFDVLPVGGQMITDVPTTTTSAFSTGDSANQLAIGALTISGGNNIGVKNRISKTLIYNRRLTDQELVGIGHNLVTPSSGLVSHWAFRERSGTTIADLTGVANGALVGSPSFIGVPAYAQLSSFDTDEVYAWRMSSATDATALTIPHSAAHDISAGKKLVIELDAAFYAIPGNVYLVDKQGANNGIYVLTNAATIQFGYGNGLGWLTANLTRLYAAACTRLNEFGKIKIEVDGTNVYGYYNNVLTDSVTISSAEVTNNTANWAIMRYTGGSFRAPIHVSAVKFWANTTDTTTEPAFWHKATAAGVPNSSITDLSGNGNTASISSPLLSWSSQMGASGSASTVDTTYMLEHNSTAGKFLDFGTHASYLINDGGVELRDVIMRRAQLSNARFWDISVNSSNLIDSYIDTTNNRLYTQCYMGGSTIWSSYIDLSVLNSGFKPLSDNLKHTWMFTWQSASVARVYCDGIMIASFNLGSGVVNFPSSPSFRVGNSVWAGTSYPFNGYTAGVKLFSGIITPQDALNSYLGQPIPQQVAYWALDEGNGTTTALTSGSGNPGTITTVSPAWVGALSS